MVKGASNMIFFIFLIAGLYFLNLFFNFITLPESFNEINRFMNLIGGIMIIIGGFYLLKSTKRKKKAE